MRINQRERSTNTKRTFLTPKPSSNILVRSVVDQRDTEKILKAFGTDYKWDYELSCGFKKENHVSPVSGTTSYSNIVENLKRNGWDIFRAARGVAGRKTIDAITRLFEREFSRKIDARFQRRRAKPVYQSLQKIASKLQHRIQDDIENGKGWMFLSKNTIYTRRWKAENFKGIVKYKYYSPSLYRPLIETGQLLHDIKVWVKPVEHSTRFGIASGEIEKTWNETEEHKRQRYYENVGDVGDAAPTGESNFKNDADIGSDSVDDTLNEIFGKSSDDDKVVGDDQRDGTYIDIGTTKSKSRKKKNKYGLEGSGELFDVGDSDFLSGGGLW